jgi:hypothetical protein
MQSGVSAEVSFGKKGPQVIAEKQRSSGLDDLLNYHEACRLLGISRRTFFNYVSSYKGRPPLLSSVKTRGGRKVRRGVIEHFIASRTTHGQYDMSEAA